MNAPIPPHDPNVGQPAPQQPNYQQPNYQQPNPQQPNYQQPAGGPATFGEIGKKYTDLAKANTTVNPKLVPFLWATAGAGFIVVIAAFLPWVSFTGGSVSGTEGGDGVFTLILALAAGAVAVSAIFLAAKQQLLPRAAGIAAIVAGALVVLIAIIDISNVSDSNVSGYGLVFDFSVGFGLWLTLIAGLALLGLGIATLIVGKRV